MHLLRSAITHGGVTYTAVLHTDLDVWIYSNEFAANEIVARGRWTGAGIECGAVLGGHVIASMVVYRALEEGLRALLQVPSSASRKRGTDA